ncbi:MAG: ergothioneine biosynthesis protein EgtB [Gammaproteobacteria bacterium]|nr:ergothioneine biosynthesis protein EgtB [Gammaproteobacteria bacterium]
MQKLNPNSIANQLQDAHQRTMALIHGLSDQQLIGPLLATVNPLLWEIGHAAYFYEYWVLRQHMKMPPIREDADGLYDSITIAHDDRWTLPLPELQQTLAYIRAVEEEIKACLADGDDPQRDYLAQYAVFHHDMHNEAYTYTRQILQYPEPQIGKAAHGISSPGGLDGDVSIPGGSFLLGAKEHDGFVFDNEKWAYAVEIEPFRIARAAVSNGDYLKFVKAGGYTKQEYWDNDGWQWLKRAGLEHPVYWRHDADGWMIRKFDQWQPLSMHAALIHVSWYEAQAYCRWAGRRLPTEAEWEVAAAAEPTADGRLLAATKRHFPWGNEAPRPDQANLDGYALGTVDVGAHAAGDSAFGCRQMIGNVWEWTQDTFAPYPGFVPDMYQDYSQPLFGITKVLRGGAWPTRARMIRNTWRTYYGRERNDVFAGFRTCAITS